MKRVPKLDSKLFFPLPTFTKLKQAFIGLAQYGPSLEEKNKFFKNTKCPNTSEKEQAPSLGEKSLLIKKKKEKKKKGGLIC